MSGILEGIDISHHNYYTIKSMAPDYLPKMAKNGFVIMKATEGRTWRDPKMSAYMAMLPDLDSQIGFYHYARPEINGPTEEANNFLETVRFHVAMAPRVLALDVEGKALVVPELDSWCRIWLNKVYEETGIKPLVYCQRSALKLFEEVPAGDYGLWLASWSERRPKETKPWPFMAIWQYSALGIDKDYFFGSKEQWRRYAGVNG